MKRSAASAWNYLLSLEGDNSKKPQVEESTQPNRAHLTPARTATPNSLITEQHELLHLNDGVKLVIGMVGLPARGKTHVARKVTNYFSWIGYAARHFEVAAYRREKLGAVESEKFFDPSNKMGHEARVQLREAIMDSMITWLQDEGQVAIYDTSNATSEQRRAVKDKLERSFRGNAPTSSSNIDSGKSSWCRLIWIECVCDDPATIERNFFESTIHSADFNGFSRDNAFDQFNKKMEHYKSYYCGLEEDSNIDSGVSFIKISDGGKHVVAHNVMGYLEAKLVSFVMNIHSEPRVVLLARHGQTDYNVHDRVGGDSDLTELGRDFSKSLAKFCYRLEHNNWEITHEEVATLDQLPLPAKSNRSPSELVVWTSTANRAIQTVEHVFYRNRVAWNALTEIDAGVCEAMTYIEIKTKMPLEYAERQKDKYHWRYPRGESYADVTKRLEPVIFEIERQRRPVLVIAHRAVLRCLLGYFQGTPKYMVPYIPVPLHHVFVLNSGREGWKSKGYFLSPQVEDPAIHREELEKFNSLYDQGE